jgi:hypothetical protein
MNRHNNVLSHRSHDHVPGQVITRQPRWPGTQLVAPSVLTCRPEAEQSSSVANDFRSVEHNYSRALQDHETTVPRPLGRVQFGPVLHACPRGRVPTSSQSLRNVGPGANRLNGTDYCISYLNAIVKRPNNRDSCQDCNSHAEAVARRA